ncbi:hypothetical protein [Adhaeribacter radiodurans]|nr:hypothetical protein [Adhaeribacter radiodurans]
MNITLETDRLTGGTKLCFYTITFYLFGATCNSPHLASKKNESD